MKILVVSDAWKPQVNGVVRTYEYIGAELEAMGHEMAVIGPADFPCRMKMPGYPEIELALFAGSRLRRLIDEASADVIHIATEGPLGRGARNYCLKKGWKFTTCYHTQFPDYVAKRVAKFIPFLGPPVKKLVIKSVKDFHNKAGAVFVATQSLEDELRSWGFIAPLRRLTRGALLDIFRPGPPEVFKDLKRPVALFVGRVAIEKNLEAFLGMEWQGTKAIVGDGPDMAELKRKYPDTLFAGKKVGEELGKHYRSGDVFVFPSRTDTFGMVLVEALASGLPVAAYNVTGPRDIITQPFLGVLDDDLATAAKKALNLADQKDARRKYVEQHYTWPAVAEQFMSVISEVGK